MDDVDRLVAEATWTFQPSLLVRRLYALADIYEGSGNTCGARDLRQLLSGEYNPLPPSWRTATEPGA